MRSEHQGSAGAPPAQPTTRRRLLVRGLLAGGALVLGGGVAWWGGTGRGVRAATRAMMGTTATILVAHARGARAEAAVEAALARMEAVAERMTRFRADSDVGRVNAAPGQWVPVHPQTVRVVEQALAIARASDGAFDPALDRLSTLWGFHDPRRPRTVPSAAHLAPWRQRHLYRVVQSTAAGERTDTVALRLAHPAAGLDLGGIAKGYAVDEAVAELQGWGITSALVEAGGDLRALGRDPEGRGWAVGVRHPRDPRKLLATLRLEDEAAATSGDYVQFFESGGRRYSHLLEPGTAGPARYLRGITVRAPRAVLADALATAACALPPAAGESMLRRLGARGWIGMDAAGNILTS